MGCTLRLNKQMSIDHRALCWIQTQAEERVEHRTSSIIMSSYVLCGMQTQAEDRVEHRATFIVKDIQPSTQPLYVADSNSP